MGGTLTCIGAAGARLPLSFDGILSDEQRERVRIDTLAWIKSLRDVRYDGVTMRDRFRYRGDSLWWFTELYLQKTRHLEHAMAVIATLDAARARYAPARLELDHSNAAVQAAARAFAESRGVPLSCTPPASFGRDTWSSYAIGLTTRLSRLRPGRRQSRRRPVTVAAFVHSAFWRRGAGTAAPGQENYIGPILEALASRLTPEQLQCVGLGPRRNFQARRWWDPVLRRPVADTPAIAIEDFGSTAALAGSLDLWRRRNALAHAVTAGADIRRVAIVQDCDLWPVLRHDLAGAARLQWPWSARAMDEAAAAIDVLSPSVVVTYAEAGGWGRALILEARRRQVPSVGVQHGFIYRHWLNYRHAPDEIQAGTDGGFPFPTRTLVFDRYAARHLVQAGHLPAETLRVTGNPRLDSLAARFFSLNAVRRTLRRELGVAPGGGLAVLAAKFSEIRTELPALFRAVDAIPGLQLCIKTHPAETPALYEDLANRHPRIRVEPASSDLARLLAAADTVVTMNSTVAIDGLLLGVPALVIGRNTNLQPFVDAEVMMGASGEKIGPALQTVLYDREARAALVERARTFVAREEMRADGGAAVRAAEAILQAAQDPAGNASRRATAAAAAPVDTPASR